jgi:hypothetical protein
VPSPFKTKAFRDLEKKWYDKLADKGFKDLERRNKWGREEGRLKTDPLENIPHFYNVEQFQIKEEYYRMAGQFLHEYKFKTALERIIWDMHTQGISVRNIVKKLQSKGHTAYKDLVHGAIKRLAAEMRTSVRKK